MTAASLAGMLGMKLTAPLDQHGAATLTKEFPGFEGVLEPTAAALEKRAAQLGLGGVTAQKLRQLETEHARFAAIQAACEVVAKSAQDQRLAIGSEGMKAFNKIDHRVAELGKDDPSLPIAFTSLVHWLKSYRPGHHGGTSSPPGTTPTS